VDVILFADKAEVFGGGDGGAAFEFVEREVRDVERVGLGTGKSGDDLGEIAGVKPLVNERALDAAGAGGVKGPVGEGYVDVAESFVKTDGIVADRPVGAAAVNEAGDAADVYFLIGTTRISVSPRCSALTVRR
jgi:hypothetical protein